MQKTMQQATPFLRKKWAVVAALALFLVFVAVKLPTFGLAYVNRDEPLYSWQSLAIYHNPELLFSGEVNTPYSALIPAMASPLNAVFNPPIPVRAIVFLFSLVALAFTYLIGKEIFCKKTGLAAMLFLMLSPCFFYFASKAMPDVPLVALGTIAIYLLLTMNKKRAALLPFVVLAMCLIKPSSLVVLPPIAIFLTAKFRKRLPSKWVVLIILALAALFAGIFLLFEPLLMHLAAKSFASSWSYALFALLKANHFFWRIAGIPMALFALVGAIKLRKRTDLKAMMLPQWIFLTVLPFLALKIGVDRYYLLAVPAVAVIAGKGLVALIEKKHYLAISIIFIIAVGLLIFSTNFSNFEYSRDFDFANSNKRFENLSSWFSEKVGNQDSIIILSGEYYQRTIKACIEKNLPNSFEQVILNPSKEEFESIVSNNSKNHFVVVDSQTLKGRARRAGRNIWIDAKGLDWEEYIRIKGFEKVKESASENDLFLEIFYIYKKSAG